MRISGIKLLSNNDGYTEQEFGRSMGKWFDGIIAQQLKRK